jgi:hypothetical protein
MAAAGAATSAMDAANGFHGAGGERFGLLAPVESRVEMQAGDPRSQLLMVLRWMPADAAAVAVDPAAMSDSTCSWVGVRMVRGDIDSPYFHFQESMGGSGSLPSGMVSSWGIREIFRAIGVTVETQ